MYSVPIASWVDVYLLFGGIGVAQLGNACFLFDTNVPGLPYRTFTANPTNLERAQVQHFLENQPIFDV